ncbi:dynamin family protein [Trueperella bernardiae]|uniref:dynamin family protein n=1 Tax=Trueperella bernardiae TaxID=59561 RepID=UPI002949D8C5|nr:dynamin family protein [Trueperella bernardiae]MDV6238282.1 dynamin family protein [Trueperella bernardiae]
MNDFPQLPSRVAAEVRPFRESLDALVFPLAMAGSEDSLSLYADAINQLDDYVIPRYETLEAPLLAVFGGSTGAGKSTLINSMLGEEVALASAIRPTTRRPLLLHHPEDAHWFTDQRIFPHLARVISHGPADLDSAGEAGDELEIRATDLIPRGMALLDSPDIDSVVVENRHLAAQFLAAADLWVFVTTAARYADAIPWAMLDEAAERNVVVGIVLNRVPPGTGAQVRPDLDRMLGERGLEYAPLFVLSEQKLQDGMVAAADVAPIRGWLEGLASDAQVRASVARQTLTGTVDKLLHTASDILAGYDEQLAGADSLRWDINAAFDRAEDALRRQASDGSLLRGEVLSRWQDVVGTGEWARKLEKGVSSLRDRITGFFKASVDTSTVEEALEDNVLALLLAEADAANAHIRDAWRAGIAGPLVERAKERLRGEAERREAAERLVREWQAALIALIRNEGESKRLTARALAFSINAVGVALIIVVFASTGGLIGGEIAVAGGTAVVAQRVLEAVFGDEAVRRMAKEAREDLDARVREFLGADRAAWQGVIDELGLSRQIRDDYARQLRALTEAKIADGRNL